MERMPRAKLTYPIYANYLHSSFRGAERFRDDLISELESEIVAREEREEDYNSDLLAKTLKILLPILRQPAVLENSDTHIKPTTPKDVYEILTEFGLDISLTERLIQRLVKIHEESNNGLFQQT